MFIVKILLMIEILVGLPLLGLALAGIPVHRYLEFPPRTRYVTHAPFSVGMFILYTLIVLILVALIIIRWMRTRRCMQPASRPHISFPWWGWFGSLGVLISWFMAWTRFDWFSRFQLHTFTPLWISYILAINALAFRRDGRCIMIQHPVRFLLLFPVSALFWWFFEYINRFVQNWSYTGIAFSPIEYFWYATLSFSTVLPAVYATSEWIKGFSWIDRGFQGLPPLRCPRPKLMAWAALIVSAAGLTAIGVWPSYFFPLVWLSPFLIIVAIQTLMGDRHVLSGIARGDWRKVVVYAMAALFCGCFWEMWNYYSLAKWEYAIPFVHRYEIFEMPILGYAGYLPFGLECAVFIDMLGVNKEDE